MYRPSSSLFVLSFVGLVGCGSDAPPPDEVRARIAKDLVAVADTAEASRADGASLPDTTQFALLQGALSSVTGSAAFDTISTEVSARMAPRMSNLLAPPAEGDPFDGAAAAQWLNDNLFTNANHAGDGVYNVPASLVCMETVYDDNGIATGEALDPACAQAFAKIQLRIRVSDDDDVLKFALQIGPHHDEPLEVGLSATLLSLSVDLDELEAAARALLPKFGEEVPNFALDGKATAKLEVLGAAAARVSFAIDRGISVRFADPGESLAGPNAFEFSSRAANVFSLALDGNVRSMELLAGLGETHAKIPDQIDGPTELNLAGLTAELSYADGQPLKIKNFSLGQGPLSVLVDGQPALHAELNPSDGHAFHGQITGDLLEVSPRIDFRTQTNHALLGEAEPVYDVRRVLIEGGLRGRADDSVEVVGGRFEIETNPTTYGFAAVANQCVRGTEAYDTTRGAYYTQFTVGACN